MLSAEQQNIIENSIWVVNTALKRQGLQTDEDLRQSAILYMCKCLERYDATRGIKWGTYAYKNVFLFIKRTHLKECKKQALIADEDVYDIEEPLLKFAEKETVFDNGKYELERIKSICSKDECSIIELKKRGYKVVEISKLMRCSANKITSYMQNIKEKSKILMRD